MFDTGKKAVGGRCSSRVLSLQGEKVIFDHSAQYIQIDKSIVDPIFMNLLESLEAKGVVKEWVGEIGTIDAETNQITTTTNSETTRYVAVNGMGELSKHLADGLEVSQNVWVNKLEKVGGNKWRLYANGKQLGEFDAVIIAHNGKCADKLVSSVSHIVPEIHDRLKVNFGPSIKGIQNMRKMQLCSLWVLVFAVKARSIDDSKLNSNNIEACIVNKSSKLSWICNTSKKLGMKGSVESWTVISTKEFAAANKVPQENVPKEVDEKIKHDLLREFESLLGLEMNKVQPIVSKAQLWGAAIPINRYNAPFIYDGKHQIGVCGDWFKTGHESLGPSIESSYMSAYYLAQHISSSSEKDAFIENNKFGYEICEEMSLSGNSDLGASTSVKMMSGPLLFTGPPNLALGDNTAAITMKKKKTRKPPAINSK